LGEPRFTKGLPGWRPGESQGVSRSPEKPRPPGPPYKRSGSALFWPSGVQKKKKGKSGKTPWPWAPFGVRFPFPAGPTNFLNCSAFLPEIKRDPSKATERAPGPPPGPGA